MKLSKAQNILYHIVRTLFYIISLLPMRVLYIVSDMVCPFVRAFYRRKLVRQQLTECFPEKTLQEIKAIERAFYHQFCDLFVEIVKQFSMSREEMMRRMVFLDNDMFDKLFLDLREQYGGECIPMRKTVRRLLQLNAGDKPVICGMIADQQPRWDAIHHFSTFLGHDSAVFIGTEEVAKKLNSLVYYGSVSRVKRGYYECKIIPISLHPNDMPDYQITDRYMELLEQDIRQHPELWLWTHKRWTRTKEEWEERGKQ